MDYLTNLGLLLVADSVSNAQVSNLNLQKARDQKEFLSQNSYVMVLSKTEKTHIFKEDEHYLSVLGLTTGQKYDNILVNASLFAEAYKGYIFAFENHKEDNINIFKALNKSSGALVLKKYLDKNNQYVRLFGLDSQTIGVFSCSKDYYNEINEGETILKMIKEHSTEIETEKQSIEDTWYNVPNYYTFDVENIIDNAKENDILYIYFKESEVIKTFTISIIKPEGDHIFINNFEETMFLQDALDALDKDEEVPDEIRNRCIALVSSGVVCMSIKALNDYPIQSRKEICNMVNSIWGIGMWFELGKYSTIMKKLKVKTTLKTSELYSQQL